MKAERYRVEFEATTGDTTDVWVFNGVRLAGHGVRMQALRNGDIWKEFDALMGADVTLAEFVAHEAYGAAFALSTAGWHITRSD